MFKRIRLAILSGLLPLAASLALLAWVLTRRREQAAQPARIVLPVTGLPEEPVGTVEVTTGPEVPAAQAEETAKQIVPDDLTRIEGIGPKIAAVLNEAGVHTFGQLAALNVEQIKGILAGKVRLARPDTWPEQAALAARGDWEGLTALQATLKGGVPKP